MAYRSIKTKYKDIVLNEQGDSTIEREGIPKRKYSIVHDNGIYRLTAMNVRIREEKGYSMETTLVYSCKYNAAKIAEGRYSQSKANQYASNIDQLDPHTAITGKPILTFTMTILLKELT
jgi:hypothetical protein